MAEPALPVWSVIPFVGLLLSIALLPLVAPRFWHRRYPLVALLWAAAFGVPFLALHRVAAAHAIAHVYLAEYVPFLILIAGLFTVTGGIVVRGTPGGSPLVNTAVLAIGTLVASFIGTTGAAMLLIRPLLRANAGRTQRTHLVVFFIFLVANIGGCLTPLGDPPLFLGFLQGVPFFWTLRLAGPLAVTGTLLLAAFFVIDLRACRRDRRSGWTSPPRDGPLRIEGIVNLVLLAGIVAAVLLSGSWEAGSVHVAGVALPVASLVRDALIVALAALSLLVTAPTLRAANQFSWAPIREVAWLFAAIFVTIVPALALLSAGIEGPLGFLLRPLDRPWQYFWAAGGLSAFLDNAPTYLAFFHSLLGRFHPGVPEADAVRALVNDQALHLAALAAGAVFMGAFTYIGNAPNFMVMAIAEQAEVRMPSFFGYLFRWSIPLLVPVFLLVGWVFF